MELEEEIENFTIADLINLQNICDSTRIKCFQPKGQICAYDVPYCAELYYIILMSHISYIISILYIFLDLNHHD
jgi:hypothetical protein